MQVCSVCQRCYDDTASSCTKGCFPALTRDREGDPEMIDGYRLDSLIRSGTGFGLYRGHECASGGPCLIRIVSPTDTEARTFLQEAKLVSALFHPNIVDVYQTGLLDDGHAFVVTEDVDGRTLRSFLDDFGVPKLLTTIEIIRQAAEALHALHLAGVTHRAINPENIVLTKDTSEEVLVRLLPPDFGGITQRSTISNKFAIDGALSSIRYFAPEQCLNEETSARTDVYGLGIVFYELLAGAPPFDASSATALIHKHRSESPPDIRIDNFELRMLVTHSLTESLQKPSRLRQSSANLLARQLRHIQQLATHSSTPPPAGTVSVQPPRPVYTPAFSPEPIMQREEIATTPLPSVDIQETVAESKAPIPVAELIEQVTNEPEVIASIHIPEAPQPKVLCVDTLSDDLESGVHAKTLSRKEEAANVEPIIQIESVPVVASEAAAVEIQHRPARRSRLKGWKKKLHTMAARLTDDPVQSPPMVPAAEEIVDVSPTYADRVAEVEAPAIVATVECTGCALETNKIEETVDVEFALRAEVAVDESITAKAAPAKIEWQQPLDDLPTMEEVAATLVAESMIASGDQSKAPDAIEARSPDAEEIAEPIVYAREAIESEPEVNVAAVVEAATPNQPIEAEPEIAIAKQIIEPPAVLTLETEVTDIEIPRESKRIVSKAVKAKKEDMGLKADLPGFRMRRYVASAQRVRVDDEEITIVRPPSRQIKIDLEGRSTRVRQSRPRKRPASDTMAYYPTLLGSSNDAPAIRTERRQEMFSDVDAPAGFRISSYRRSIVLGCGFIALLGLILFGNDSLTSYFQRSSSADSSVSPVPKTSAPSESRARAGVTVELPEKEKSKPVERLTKALAAEKRVTEPDAPKSKSAVAPEPKAAKSERSKKSAANETKAIDKKAVDKKVVDEKAEIQRKPAEKKPVEKKPSSQEKTGAGTRPRIVKTSN